MNTAEAIESEQLGPARWLYLNRPHRRNALDDIVVDELLAALSDCIAEDSVEVIVLAGRGRSFCAGADLEHLMALGRQPEGPMPFLMRVAQLVRRLETCPKPVVAAVHGHVVAGGLELALACDVVVAAQGTLIGDGHLRNRLLPAAGSSVRLSQRVGHALARWLLLTGELLPADRFAQAGWLNAVVPEGSLYETAASLAAQLADAAGPAQRNLKTLLARIDRLPAGDAFQAEHEAFEANWIGAEVPDALAAFVARRDGSPLARDGHVSL